MKLPTRGQATSLYGVLRGQHPGSRAVPRRADPRVEPQQQGVAECQSRCIDMYPGDLQAQEDCIRRFCRLA